MSAVKCMGLAKNKGFQDRIKYFLTKSATAIIGEDSETAGHAERLIYAKQILSGEASVYEFAVGVVTNSTVAASIAADTDPSDNDLEFTVNSLINDFAGIDA